MVTTTLRDSQHELEAVRDQLWRRHERGELTLEQVMGQVTDWQVEVGKQRLLLHPPTKQWLILDRLHDTWVPLQPTVPVLPQVPRPKAKRTGLVRLTTTLVGIALSALGIVRSLSGSEVPAVLVSPELSTTSMPDQTATSATGATIAPETTMPPETTAPPTTAAPVTSTPATATCVNLNTGFTVDYPADWHAAGTDFDGSCTLFDPRPIEPTEGAPVAIAIYLADWPYEELVASYAEAGVTVHFQSDFEVDGRRASSILYTFEADDPEPDVSAYDVVIEYGDATLVLTSYEPFTEDFGAAQGVLDSMAASVRFLDG